MSSTEVVIHVVPQAAEYCSCGQDAVTCQSCDKTVCGDIAVYDGRLGNIGTCCFAKFGWGHQGTKVENSVARRLAEVLIDDIVEISNDDIPVEFQTYPPTVEEIVARQPKFRQWCKETNTFYYARPREAFFVREAYRLAAEAGCSRLLMEDMS